MQLSPGTTLSHFDFSPNVIKYLKVIKGNKSGTSGFEDF